MWNRRDFLSTALAAPALAAMNIQKPATGLTVHFIGGTLFKPLPDGGGYLAVQPTGGTSPCPKDMVERHRTLIIGPKGLRLPTADNKRVGSVDELVKYLGLGDYADFLRDAAVYCPEQTHVKIGSGGRPDFDAKKVADYSQRIVKWRPSGCFDIRSRVPPQLSSRFELLGGKITDGEFALNRSAARVPWKVEGTNGPEQMLSDVTNFVPTAAVLTINDDKPFTVLAGTHLVVLGAPIRKASDLKSPPKGKKVPHPRILRTLYENVDCNPMDLVTEKDVTFPGVDRPLPHPCEPVNGQRSADASGVQYLAPPYTEFCPNYTGP